MLTIVSFFLTGDSYREDTNNVLKAIHTVSNQVSIFQRDMRQQFNLLFKGVKYETCKQRFAIYENRITAATAKLRVLSQNTDPALDAVYKQDLIDACANSDCEEAVHGLISALKGDTGLFGCDLLEILYQGPGFSGYVGHKTQIAQNSSYLMMLITSGMIVTAAYLSISTGRADAWKAVDNMYGESVREATQRIQDILALCDTESWNNAWTNAKSILIAKNGVSNRDMSEAIWDMLKNVHPQWLWQVTVFNKVAIGATMAHYKCSELCIDLSGQSTTYSVLIAAVSHGSVMGTVAPEDKIRYAGDVIINGAFKLLHWFQFQGGCYTGALAIAAENGQNEFTHSEFWHLSRVVQGTQNRLVLWSVAGKPCISF